MGFFKDFKDDFSQAVNELMPGEDTLETGNRGDLVVNTLESEVDVESELSKLDGLLEQVTRQEAARETRGAEEMKPAAEPQPVPEVHNAPEAHIAPTPVPELQKEQERFTMHQAEEAPEVHTAPSPAPIPAPAAVPTAQEAVRPVQNTMKTIQEEKKMADIANVPMMNQERPVTDEVTVITEGTVIKGDIVSSGSLDVRGQVEGNVGCNGKLTVTGIVNGNSNVSEFFADSAKIEGEVVSTGTVKIGLGSVIIGNVTSSSAVIAGAIKGDIDVQGPVVVDTSAVIMGNIKSRTVQINNGAVIEGFCSQCYSDVDVESLFGDKKGIE